MNSKLLSMPSYTKTEEIWNMTTHIVGGSLGFVTLLTCAIVAALYQNIWGIVGGCVYGISVILLFTVSSIYHGLPKGSTKYIFRILDHCMIYILIAGTYTPILLSKFYLIYPVEAITMLAVLWGLAIIGITINIIDIERFKWLSLFCYLAMGWLAIFKIVKLIEVLGSTFFILIFAGGIIYTIGVLFYISGRKKKYMHSVFHLFVNLASIMHSIAIIAYIMPK